MNEAEKAEAAQAENSEAAKEAEIRSWYESIGFFTLEAQWDPEAERYEPQACA